MMTGLLIKARNGEKLHWEVGDMSKSRHAYTGMFKVAKDTGDKGFSMLDRYVVGSVGTYPANMSIFLHGSCTVFALALHEWYGYKVYRLYNADDVKDCGNPCIDDIDFPIVHDLCIKGSKNLVYIDVRGITTDFDAVKYPFEDFIGTYKLTQLTEKQVEKVRENCIRALGKQVYSDLLACALRLIQESDAYIA